jgi:hypothetical protein
LYCRTFGRSSESEALIAASTAFKIDGVEYIIIEFDDFNHMTIPMVKMTYFLPWFDFDINEFPSEVLIEDDEM